jgi:hypothetical protein
VVRGGLLGTGQYEHDVTLDATRLAWIMPRLTLDNGAPPKTLGPFGFDRDKRPNIVSVSLTGTVLSILCDTDTKSIRVTNSAVTWIYEADGLSLTVDVSKTGTNGAAGLGLLRRTPTRSPPNLTRWLMWAGGLSPSRVLR